MTQFEEQPAQHLLDGYHLLPGEALRRVIAHEKREFDQVPSSLEQMMRLTRASQPNDIGKHGPSVAALAFETLSNDTLAPDHLKLYEVVFGRDSQRAAIDLISSYPELARSTVVALAEFQGLTFDHAREEEPGRIVHEARDANDPIAQKLTQELGWDWPYYGSVDATPEFIRTLAAYCQRTEENRAFLTHEYTDKNGDTRTITHAFEMALEWIERRLSLNKEGILEFQSVIPKGIENQVWKDSWDAYHHADGTLANHQNGIASIEVQVTTYDALIDAAELYEDVLDQPVRAEALRLRADILRQTIFDIFWCEEKGGYFVLGTDRDENNNVRQLKIRTSNMGHTLNSRLLEGDRPDVVTKRQAVLRHMLSKELLNHSGIRTLASDEYRFRPGSYHCGSVWLWDTHHIAKGMRRLGYHEEADEIDRRLLNVIDETRVFPEYVRGDDAPVSHINHHTIVLWDEINQRENKLEQPPQEVQAWTVAAILAIKKRLSRRNIGAQVNT